MSLFDLTCGYIISPAKEPCQKQSTGEGFCKEHQLKCRCGKEAQFGCPYVGALVCGFPVCNNCGWCVRHPNGIKKVVSRYGK